MMRNSRSYKMVELCKTPNESEFLRSNRKKSRWFCNRALSPPSLCNPKEDVLENELQNWNTSMNVQENLSASGESYDEFVTKEEVESHMETYQESVIEEKPRPKKKILVHQIITVMPPVKFSSDIQGKEISPEPLENGYENSEECDSPDSQEEKLYTCTKKWSPRNTDSSRQETIIESMEISTNDEDSLSNDAEQTGVRVEETSAKPGRSYKRKADYCYYCESEVKNFSRHIRRNHPREIEVSEILSKPVGSKERRVLLNKLRRKGNFLGSNAGYLKPVRQPYLPDRSVLPCDNCLGLFSSKLLYRHRKKCSGGNCKGSSQAAGQSKMVTNSRVDKRLKEEVFPHMRAARISLEAKNDTLICAFGARYLNTHRERHFVHVTSRKMRELTKMLIEVRKLEPAVTNMFSALQPKYFDHFVEATKRIAQYDLEKDVYMSPTFAMNIVTSLKQCCDIAITYAYKRHAPYSSVSSGEAEANLKTLIHLFETNWRFEVSSQAANNLSLNKWNKITVIPLASDLKLLRGYLITLAENAMKSLNENRNARAYNNLIESVYCRVILLNRKRSGELQRMLLHTYETCSVQKQEYKEFNKVVSSAEQILLKSLKRVVIRGKRGRGVPVLFSTDVQNHIKILLEIRDEFVPKENPYLFAKANSSSHIIGYKILSKHAKCCGAKNPTSITSTRLRKHLATLSQLFSLSENEIGQLATFMGHTPGVHRSSYRLPDDVYQTTKISKLLLIMEKGGASEFKGKSLDEVNIDMEKDLLENKQKSNESEESDCEDINESNTSSNAVPSTSADVTSSGSIPRKAKRVLVPWTCEQKRVVKQFFKNHIKNSKPPKKNECEQLKSKYQELLQNEDWLKIKVFLQNEYTK